MPKKKRKDVQRGNGAAVMVTIPSSQDWAEFLLLCRQNVDEFAGDDFVIAALTIFWLC